MEVEEKVLGRTRWQSVEIGTVGVAISSTSQHVTAVLGAAVIAVTVIHTEVVALVEVIAVVEVVVTEPVIAVVEDQVVLEPEAVAIVEDVIAGEDDNFS